MDKKGWLIFSVIVIALFGILIYRSQSEKITLTDVDPFQIQGASENNGEIADHVLNPSDNSLTLIEYGDFQCPGCQSMYPIVHKITEEFASDIQYVFRSYPLSYHANAKASAAAAESAGLQDRYWDMFDMIYSNPDDWENAGATERTEVFLRYAKELGLDTNRFKEDLDSERVKKKINFDVSLANLSNVTATPTFFLNGEKLDSDKIVTENGFREIVKEALSESSNK